MRIRLIRETTVDHTTFGKSVQLDVEDRLGVQLIEKGFAEPVREVPADIETATAPEGEKPEKGKRGRKAAAPKGDTGVADRARNG